ncbi:MAG: DUF169 domain-containing protein [Pseudomonadota bacterium]|jgi:hypothetical protein
MAPTLEGIERLTGALRLKTPIIGVYDTEPSSAFEPSVQVKGRACCFAYYPRWLKGETLVIKRGDDDDFMNPQHGCPGLQKHFGFDQNYPPWMANFLTDGKNGAPMGEGLKATPALAQEFLDNIVFPEPSGDHILIGPLKPDLWDKVRTVTFLTDPDRLSGLMTLAAFWSSDPDEIAAPFSSGCGLMWEVLNSFKKDRAVIGATDLAMRRYIPPEIITLTVSPERFERMVDFPDDAFLNRSWWNELMDSREKGSNS